jgi:S-formylglutathione hydrolase FrmB
VIHLQHHSKCLADNLWDDPTERVLPVYLPPGYDDMDGELPVFVDLVAFTGAGPAHVNWEAFKETLPQRLDRLIAEGAIGPVVCLFPDCFTSLGGNQYIDSSAVGAYAQYLLHEVLPLAERELRIRPGAGNRAVFGKSSGGYGALIQGMRYAEHWGALACHSGDSLFELVYRNDMPVAINTLARHDNDVLRFLRYFWRKEKPAGHEVHTLMMICMAASYDPDPDVPLGFHLPFDLHTGELDEQRWARWKQHDPVELVARHADALKSLKGIFIDCGRSDQYNIHFGTRLLSRRLREAGVSHVHEEFEGTHSGIDHRMDVSLPFLYRCIAGEP